ncbi:MAG: thiolase domain-containing protein [Ilumatobacter sp.]|nr:MAG: thiolase domain-containing protein [Ilumatobacter sp.]
MAQRAAVVGVGQTHHKKRRDDVSIVGLVREAAERALADAECDWSDIDALVIGKAPDAFEGIVQPEIFLAEALGAVGKPMLRVHTAGSVGGSTFIVASHLVESGVHDRVLSLAWEKQSEGNAQWGLAGGRSGGVGAGGAFAPWMRAYIASSGAPEYIGWMVAVKDRLNALRNPYAHLKLADISIEKVKESAMLWDPIRFLESCPSSDGAAAAVITNEAGVSASSKPPAWVAATSVRSELGQFPGRDTVKPQAGVECARDVYRQAGITNPREEIDVAELYVPFSWYEPMWLEGHEIAEPGQGWVMVDKGETEIGGSFPVNPSGGVLSSNPIGASGMLRMIEAANQVRGQCGDYQIDGARTALAQAYGGAAQYFAMSVFRSTKD